MGYIYSYCNTGNCGTNGNSSARQYVNKNKNTKGTLNAKTIEMMSSKEIEMVLIIF